MVQRVMWALPKRTHATLQRAPAGSFRSASFVRCSGRQARWINRFSKSRWARCSKTSAPMSIAIRWPLSHGFRLTAFVREWKDNLRDADHDFACRACHFERLCDDQGSTGTLGACGCRVADPPGAMHGRAAGQRPFGIAAAFVEPGGENGAHRGGTDDAEAVCGFAEARCGPGDGGRCRPGWRRLFSSGMMFRPLAEARGHAV